MSAGPIPVDAWPGGPATSAGEALHPLFGTVTGEPPQGTDDWHWQLALHTLAAGAELPTGPAEPGQITPLDAPLQLHQHDGHSRALLRLQVARGPFTGRALAAEATRVVSLRIREGVAAELIARPLQGPMLLPTGARWMAWLLAGRAEVQWGDTRWPLPVDRPMWLPDDNARRLRIDGGGEVLLLKIDARGVDPLTLDTLG
ncbi:MAG: hypothetical protein ABT19_10045 [Rhodanobacter sp. SCN 68-63]|nr:MAG: hypothetical protein ABT19_10045 [Rhodanobacter sp. SCN 68-63]